MPSQYPHESGGVDARTPVGARPAQRKPEPEPYKSTLFDRHGPDAEHLLVTAGYMVLVLALAIALFTALSWKLQLHGLASLSLIVFGASASTAAIGWAGYRMGNAVGTAVQRVAVDGTSTPYKEQYSYQQALVMQGRLDDALESFEAIIAEQPLAIEARLRAAELYTRNRQNHVRAAELFRQVQRIPAVRIGDDVHATHRLVDLLTGPLGDRGRALVELRRLVEKYPGTRAAEQARTALAELKTRP